MWKGENYRLIAFQLHILNMNILYKVLRGEYTGLAIFVSALFWLHKLFSNRTRLEIAPVSESLGKTRLWYHRPFINVRKDNSVSM